MRFEMIRLLVSTVTTGETPDAGSLTRSRIICGGLGVIHH
jgi:hypothetical protein